MNKLVKSKQLMLLLVLVMGLSLAVGCSNQAAKQDGISADKKSASLKLSISVPEGKRSIQSITDDVKVEKIKVSLINQQTQEEAVSKTKQVTDGQVELAFNKLTAGVKYKVKVKAKDTKDNVIYKGSKIKKVAADAVNSVKIDLKLTASKKVVLRMKNMPETAAVGTVTLIRHLPNKENIQVDFTPDSQRAVFKNIPANIYDFEIKLFKTEAKEEQISGFPLQVVGVKIYPGRNTVTEPINLTGDHDDNDGDGKGELEVGVSWPEGPAPPANVNAAIKGKKVKLTWNDGVEGYVILRSKKKNPDRDEYKILMKEMISKNIYIDTVPTAGSYYYWVRAYNQNGLASDLSEPKKVTIGEEPTPDQPGVSKYTFSAGETKQVDLGVVKQGETAFVGVSALNRNTRNMQRYQPTLNVKMGGRSSSQPLDIKPMYNKDNTKDYYPNQAQAAVDKQMRQRGQEIASEVKSLQSVRTEMKANKSYAVGDTKEFYVIRKGNITAELKVDGKQAMIFVEEGVDVSQRKLQEMGDKFDNKIFPTDMKYFGHHQFAKYDIDNNNKSIILVTDLSDFSSQGTILGFFNPQDFSDRQNSNQADMFYINSQAIQSSKISLKTVLGTLAHEFQHLLFFAEKLNAQRRDINDTWINEGFAVLAGHLNGYYDYETDGRIYDGKVGYFSKPNTESLLSWSQKLSDYGASGLFGLYAYDKFGKGILEEVMTSSRNPVKVFNDRKKFEQLFLNWGIANCISNLPVKDKYQYPVDLNKKPAMSGVSQSGEINFTVGSTALKYFKINGTGEKVSLEVTDLNEKTGVVVYK